MNNTILKIIAAVLLVGALVVAYVGIQLSRNPAKPAAPSVGTLTPSPTETGVVAARSIPAGHRIQISDITTKNMVDLPTGAFQDATQAIGKIALTDISAGTVMTSSLFAPNSMAGLLRQGERAIALNVDEVSGVGGYLRPGDQVDVLLSLTGAARSAENAALAQIVVKNARLLSIGDTSQMDSEERKAIEPPAQPPTAEPGKEENKQKQNFRSAVLAVESKDITRLMLAASMGQIRLALRPLANQVSQGGPADADHQLVNLGALGVKGGGDAAAVPDHPRARVITIQEGSVERRVTLNETAPQ